MIDTFIRRPILACSIAILMIIAGVVAVTTLPVSQFPKIVPGTINVSTSYPGASAEMVAEVITTPIEKNINGIQGMIYMSSISSDNGTSSITVSFDVDFDLNFGQVEIQNAVQRAMGNLPEQVQKVGVDIQEQSTNLTAVINIRSPSGAFDSEYLGNYAQINVVDALKRVPGVGTVQNFGLKNYAVRIWLDPAKLAELGLDAMDVVNAIEDQNLEIPAGTIAEQPIPDRAAFQYQVNAQFQLPTPEDFAQIVVRSAPEGGLVRIADVGRAELGAVDYGTSTTFDGQGTATLGIFQRPDANAFDVIDGIEKVLASLDPRFPGDVEYVVAYATTNYVKASMRELVITMLQSVGLVVLVVFVFLQSWRTTIIPTVAIPVSLLFTFVILGGFDFSINILSLLGLVLAVGLVVDDAIVVVENVERQFSVGETNPKRAASKAMREVAGSIIATTAVMMAVFVPASFAPGATGRLFNQFALTIAFSVAISAFNSLTLSPALCGVLLRPRRPGSRPFFLARWFNAGFGAITAGYGRVVGVLAHVWWLVLIVFVGFIFLAFEVARDTPQAFVPVEDQGWMFAAVELPEGASFDRTQAVVRQAAEMLGQNEMIENVVTVTGYNFLEQFEESNAGVVFGIFKPWADRPKKSQQVPGILESINADFAAIPGAAIIAVAPPSIPGLGTTGGFELQVLDIEQKGNDALADATGAFVAAAMKRPEIGRMLATFDPNVPQLFVDIDREQASALGVSIKDIYQTMQVYLGSFYVNNWNQYGQVYEVTVQAEGEARQRIDDVGKLHVANRDGQMIPLDQLASVRTILAPDGVQHYNLYGSSEVIGGPGPGYSGAQAIKAVKETAEETLIAGGFDFAWTGLVYQEIGVARLLAIIFGLGVVTVFFVLAGLYESWSLPFVILLPVPLAILGAFTALKLRDMPLDVYGQIALLMMIALAAKNQILIVAFAKQQRAEGKGILEATVNAARIRLRPILMTKLAFIIGTLPLVFATGPGSNTRHSIGTTVVGGMLAAAVLSLLIVPVLFVVFEWMRVKLGFVSADGRSEAVDSEQLAG
ncbi:MAG: efflux RND transporter permease subunit [Planctomycetota bacterium]